MRWAWWALGIVVGLAVLLRIMAATIPGSRVTSWWRSPWENIRVKGVWWSMHLIGWGVDLIPVNQETEARARRLFPFVLNEGTHLHAGWVA